MILKGDTFAYLSGIGCELRSWLEEFSDNAESEDFYKLK